MRALRRSWDQLCSRVQQQPPDVTGKKGSFRYELIHRSSKPGSRARVGRIITPHGSFMTPAFVPVGTNASMKCVTTKTMDTAFRSVGSSTLMFCNTYHLMLHPGPELVRQAGGLHKFMNHPYPLITDSGGFQVFSLAYGSVQREVTTGQPLSADIEKMGVKKRKQFSTGSSVIKINENGVLFRSYRDGRKILITPEISIQAQKGLGADIIIPFDELPPYHMDDVKLRESLDRTHRWQKRSLDEHLKDKQNQAIYGIVHGGMDTDMRSISAEFVNSNEFDGTAIGGSLGKTRDDVKNITDFVMQRVHPDRPVHLLGIGDMQSIESCIPFGVDTFDSAYPTRCGRHGLLFSDSGAVKISQRKFFDQMRPLDPTCPCTMCQNHTLAYVHHLYKANEPTFAVLATEHNVTFYLRRMKVLRQLILDNRI